MTTNQEDKQSSFRTLAGVSSGTFNANILQAFQAEGITITDKTFNEAFTLWLQQKTGSMKSNINDLMNHYATQEGFYNWDSMNTIDASDVVWQNISINWENRNIEWEA